MQIHYISKMQISQKTVDSSGLYKILFINTGYIFLKVKLEIVIDTLVGLGEVLIFMGLSRI